MEDGPERLALIQRMNEMIAEDCPVVFEFAKAFYVAVQPWARWTHNNGMIEGSFNKYHQVDPVPRVRLRREWNQKPIWPAAVLAGMLVGGVVYTVRWNRRKNA